MPTPEPNQAPLLGSLYLRVRVEGVQPNQVPIRDKYYNFYFMNSPSK